MKNVVRHSDGRESSSTAMTPALILCDGFLQAGGPEVIHLGHNRSVKDIVNAAIQEDAQGIAVSSYQGGHIEFFKYMISLLERAGARRTSFFGGGGGVGS